MNRKYAALAAILLAGAVTAEAPRTSGGDPEGGGGEGGQPVLDLPRPARHQHVTRVSDPGRAAQGLLEAQIEAFRQKTRAEKDAHDFMWGIAGNLDPAIIDGIAAYYAAQPPARGHSDDPALVAKGKELFDKGVPERGIPACMACHGADATGRGRLPSSCGPAREIRGQAAELHPVAGPRGAGDARHRQGSDAGRDPGRRGLRAIEVGCSRAEVEADHGRRHGAITGLRVVGNGSPSRPSCRAADPCAR